MPVRKIGRIGRIGVGKAGGMNHHVHPGAGSRQTAGVSQVAHDDFEVAFACWQRVAGSNENPQSRATFSQRGDQSLPDESRRTGHQHGAIPIKIRRYHHRHPCRLKNNIAARRNKPTCRIPLRAA